MSSRENYRSGAKWESIAAYSRAVRIGDVIEVSGTTSVKDGKIVGIGDAYVQTQRCLEIILESLRHFGLDSNNVIRTRMYVTNIKLWEEVAKAHREVFQYNPPATTMVEVSNLIDPELLVEIEASAIIEVKE